MDTTPPPFSSKNSPTGGAKTSSEFAVPSPSQKQPPKETVDYEEEEDDDDDDEGTINSRRSSHPKPTLASVIIADERAVTHKKAPPRPLCATTIGGGGGGGGVDGKVILVGCGATTGSPAAAPPLRKQHDNETTVVVDDEMARMADDSCAPAAHPAGPTDAQQQQQQQNPSSPSNIPTLTDKDIVLGKGGYNRGQAYIRFLSFVTTVARDYVIGESNEVLIHRVLDHVQTSQGGRFLEEQQAVGVVGDSDDRGDPHSSRPLSFQLVPHAKICDKIEILLRRAFDRLPRIPTPPPRYRIGATQENGDLDGNDEDDYSTETENEDDDGEEDEDDEEELRSPPTFAARPNSSSLSVPAKRKPVGPPPQVGEGKSASAGSDDQTENADSPYFIDTPTEKDIILGQGTFFKRAGNVNFRILVTKFANFYLPKHKSHNDTLVVQIMDHVSRHGGRFVEKDPTDAAGMFRPAEDSKVKAMVAPLLKRRYAFIRSQDFDARSTITSNDKDGLHPKDAARSKRADVSTSRTDKPSSKGSTRALVKHSTRKVAASASHTDKPSSEAANGAADADRSSTTPTSLTKEDVCFGVGYLFHPGNATFRAVVAEVAHGQTVATEDMVHELVARIASLGGRFLEKEKYGETFRVATKMRVHEKILAALQRSMQNQSQQ
jgi:hypothetical protein